MITTDCLHVICPHLDLHTILALLWSCQGIRSQIKEIQPRIHDNVLFRLHEPSPQSLWKHIQLETISIQFQTYAKCGVWSPHTLLIAYSCHKVIYIWSKVTHQLVSTLKNLNDIQTLAWSSDGSLLASGSNDHAIVIWSGSSIKHRLCGHNKTVYSVAWSADNTKLVSGSTDGKVCLWDMTTGSLSQVWKREDEDTLSMVSISSDGSVVAIASLQSTSYLWHTSTGVTHVLPRTNEWLSSMTFSPDNTRVVFGYDTGLIRIYHVHTPSLLLSIEPESTLHRYNCLTAFNPDGSKIIRRHRDLTILDANTGIRLKTMNPTQASDIDCVLDLQWSSNCISVLTAKINKIISLTTYYE